MGTLIQQLEQSSLSVAESITDVDAVSVLQKAV